MSLRSKMLAMSTIPLIVLVFAVTYAVSAQRTASRTNEDVDRTTGVRRELAEIQHDLAIAESSVRGFVLTGQERMREDYSDAVMELHGDLEDLKERVTILSVTHNLQQAARVSDFTAYMYLGDLIEFGITDELFIKPKMKQTEDYITGRFG